MSENREKSGGTALLEGDESIHMAKLVSAGKKAWDVIEKPKPTEKEMWETFRPLEIVLIEAITHSKVPGENEAYLGYIELGKILGLKEEELEIILNEETGHAERRLR